MTYTAFADNKPVASDTGLTVIDDTRNNLMAMRDAVVSGFMPGWDYSPSGGTAEQPTVLTYSLGAQRIRATLTYGTTGGADGNVTSITLDYSADSGATYDPMGAVNTYTLTYDANANVTSASWS